MIAPEIREAIVALRAKGTAVRKISSTAEDLAQHGAPGVTPGALAGPRLQPETPPHLLPLLQESFARCEGNVVRVKEVLEAEHEITDSLQHLDPLGA